MSDVRRLYVEKKRPYAVAARALLEEIKGFLDVRGANGVRILMRYDVENVPDDVFETALSGVFAEPPLDDFFLEAFEADGDAQIFSVEALPGQYDQRADSCRQALSLINEDVDAIVRCATTYVLTGDISEEELRRIQTHVCNPVDSRIASVEKPKTLRVVYDAPADVPIVEGMISMSKDELAALYQSLSLAMSLDDFFFIQNHFRDEEKRDPTMTEIRVLDTYWSDHCRHTTFSTRIQSVTIEDGPYAGPIRASYERYLREKTDDKPVCLMDLATAAMKRLKESGKLKDMEESEENNACTIVVPVDVDYGDGAVTEDWLVFFKNETHNHPTEIEPFGGAATCLGGAIRDPLSGRGYVYQAMRVTGAADPTGAIADTMEGKLPQKKLVRDAAKGYSSYGNQIGLATGYVAEIYHPGYVAKRMEIGAVMGAAPRRAVVRKSPEKDDVVVLLGGRTGRDGIGGATGSSKSHTLTSLESCGAEVQKGNAPTERKIQRLFRREEVSRLIRKCNDFGAGGVCVAIGELADGLDIDLDLVTKKYEGLDGTELAISESQERMAVVVSPKDADAFLAYAAEENLEANIVARVTDTGRLRMRWRGKQIVDLSRAFLDTNGALQEADALIVSPDPATPRLRTFASADAVAALEKDDVRQALLTTLMDLNVCAQRGLVEMFDASIGAQTVLMPFGGREQATPAQTMIAKLPTLQGDTTATTLMAYGFDPYISEWSPYHGAVYAVLHSVAKIVAAGGDPHRLHFTFQEYFGKTRDEKRWGAPFAALLGAYEAQMAFETAAIGGKDSMSGTFQEIDVPPTLVSFAVGLGDTQTVVTPELKRAGNYLVLYEVKRDDCDLPDYAQALAMYEQIHALMNEGAIVACYAVDAYGVAASLAKMAYGNCLGVSLDDTLSQTELFANGVGNLIAEVDYRGLVRALAPTMCRKIGVVTAEKSLAFGETRVFLPEAMQCWTSRLEKVFPTSAQESRPERVEVVAPQGKEVYICKHKVARPRVFIPAFPGTNCEYDLTRAFTQAGADVSVGVFRNLNAQDIRESVDRFASEIDAAQILMFPGGFSAGDEPDGSAKFFAAAFRNDKIREATHRLLNERDGLALGICNGFQAMIKLGLLPNGRIEGQTVSSPTLTYNTIGRHISRVAWLKIIANHSPWLNLADKDVVYASPVSHGEGRFVGDEAVVRRLFENGQVATCYADPDGNITTDDLFNLNGSYMAIEGITSPDGRCYGKMAHAERKGLGVAANVPGEQDMKIFEAGVRYFAD